jgi:hypothetical protein
MSRRAKIDAEVNTAPAVPAGPITIPASLIVRDVENLSNRAAADVERAKTCFLNYVSEGRIAYGIEHYADDIVQYETRRDIYQEVLSMLASEGDFIARLRAVGRAYRGAMQRICNDKTWQHGRSDQVRQGVELARLSGKMDAWMQVEQRVITLVDMVDAGQYVVIDDVTPVAEPDVFVAEISATESL